MDVTRQNINIGNMSVISVKGAKPANFVQQKRLYNIYHALIHICKP